MSVGVCHTNKTRTTTLIHSCPHRPCHHQNGGLVACSLDVYRHVCGHQNVTGENETHFRTCSPPPGTCSSAGTTCGVKTLRSIDLQTKSHASLSRLQTVWPENLCPSEICFAVIVASWFDFEDDAPGCIDFERRWLFCDDLTLACP